MTGGNEKNEYGSIEVIPEKGKPKRHDLNYYPIWSFKIKPRTKEWEKEKLIEQYKVLGNEVMITPPFDKIASILEQILIHELRCDLTIGRKGDHPKYHKLFSQKAIVKKQQKLFSYGLPEIYKRCKKDE